MPEHNFVSPQQISGKSVPPPSILNLLTLEAFNGPYYSPYCSIQQNPLPPTWNNTLLRVNSYFLLSNQSQCPVTKLSWNSLPFAIRNLGIKSTFQSLPLPMDAGGAPGILNLLYKSSSGVIDALFPP